MDPKIKAINKSERLKYNVGCDLSSLWLYPISAGTTWYVRGHDELSATSYVHAARSGGGTKGSVPRTECRPTPGTSGLPGEDNEQHWAWRRTQVTREGAGAWPGSRAGQGAWSLTPWLHALGPRPCRMQSLLTGTYCFCTITLITVKPMQLLTFWIWKISNMEFLYSFWIK